VCPEDESKPLRFDDEGHIDSQQVVKLKFAKDDKVVSRATDRNVYRELFLRYYL